MTKSPFARLDFQRGNIATGGTIATALAEHRVLTAMLDRSFFVIGHADDRDRARQVATDLHTEHEGFRFVFLVLFTAEQLDALADGAQINIAVQVVTRTGRFRTHPTAIKANNLTQVTLDTEHGRYLSEVVTLDTVRAGDLYTCGAYRLGETTETGLIVYRARTDFDPTTGEILCHIVEDGQPAPADGDRTGSLDGADTLVHRIVDKTIFLAEHNLTDTAAPIA